MNDLLLNRNSALIRLRCFLPTTEVPGSSLGMGRYCQDVTSSRPNRALPSSGLYQGLLTGAKSDNWAEKDHPSARGRTYLSGEGTPVSPSYFASLPLYPRTGGPLLRG